MATNQQQDQSFARKARLLGFGLNALAWVAPGFVGRQAFHLFCTPRRSSIKPRDLEFLSTGDRNTFDFDGLQLVYYTWSPNTAAEDTPFVLLLHGWESNSARWHAYIPKLRKAGYRVVALDAPAHGQSQGREINLPLYSRAVSAFLQYYGTPYSMVGHSLGGAAVVMSMAAYQAPRAKKAVVLASFAESSRIIRNFFGLLGLQPHVQRAVLSEIKRQSGVDIEAFSVTRHATMLQDVAGLVVHDSDDQVSDLSDGEAIATAWNAKLLTTDGLGHRLLGAQVLNSVLDFITAKEQ
ncbi:MAG: alpha/beta fold hydrolase [Lewinellaceae bacterium]|nr:alpha/beta fold hydrolase [Lewinellaceae bacterium]